MDQTSSPSPVPRSSLLAPRSLLARHPWLPFVLPFVVYMLAGTLEPAPPLVVDGQTLERPNWLGFRYEHYPIVYSVKIALTVAAMLVVLSGYRQFRFRVSPLAIAVGVVGVVLWVWLCSLEFEVNFLKPLGFGGLLGLGERPAYNPLEELRANPAWAYTFLAIRFFGLSLVVPIIEEFFLRGCVMRLVVSDRWWEWPFGDVTPLAVAAGTLVPMLMHPAELLAAAVWFSLVTWLMVRTRNIWDCVTAHAVMNPP